LKRWQLASNFEAGTIHPMVEERRFTLIDGLRGIAALSVVVFHLYKDGYADQVIAKAPALAWVADQGVNGVAIFFVLSGFVIAHSLYGRDVDLALAGRFLLRRSLRLDPPYWITIAITLGYALAASRIGEYTAPQIAANVLYLQDLLGFEKINLVFWTLAYELQFYLLYIALLLVAKRNPALAVGAAAVCSIAWPAGFIHTATPGVSLPLWHGFMIGALAYWAWRDHRLVPILLACSLAILAIGMSNGNAFTITFALTALLLWTAGASGKLARWLNWRWLQFLGTISYSLYLSHNIVIRAMSHIHLPNAMLAPPMIVGCIAFAALMWALVERPSMRLARRISLQPAPNPVLLPSTVRKS
jgi:peptidoglycan/LPS O-acetylase OafA/YrhL